MKKFSLMAAIFYFIGAKDLLATCQKYDIQINSVEIESVSYDSYSDVCLVKFQGSLERASTTINPACPLTPYELDLRGKSHGLIRLGKCPDIAKNYSGYASRVFDEEDIFLE